MRRSQWSSSALLGAEYVTDCYLHVLDQRADTTSSTPSDRAWHYLPEEVIIGTSCLADPEDPREAGEPSPPRREGRLRREGWRGMTAVRSKHRGKGLIRSATAHRLIWSLGVKSVTSPPKPERELCPGHEALKAQKMESPKQFRW